MREPTIKSVDEINPVTPDWLNDAESERMVASMEYWYPRLQEVDVKTPDTEWVALEPDVIDEGTIHEHYWAQYDMDELREAVKSVDGPPAFLRTDTASNIYNMEDSSKVQSTTDEELEKSAGGVIGFNAMRAEIPFCSLVVREWLDIQYLFTSWGGKKVGVEIRTFVSDGEVEGWCFDWPRSELKPDDSDWEEKYEETMEQAESRAEEVIPMAEKVAKRFDGVGSGAWSVDFVLTEDDEWYCTDMAPKRMSQVANEINEV